MTQIPNKNTLSLDIDQLNESFKRMHPLERLKIVFGLFNPGDILATSSFGTNSAVLLHLIQQVHPGHPIHFINTGFHFEATHRYRKSLQRQLALNIIEVHAEHRRHRFTSENDTHKFNQDLCCLINKVVPLETVKGRHKVWVTGLLRYQNANRSRMKFFERSKGILKFNPIIDLSAEDVALYFELYSLPKHPLLVEGYESVGCYHCTAKGHGREGRWQGMVKNECGLHMN